MAKELIADSGETSPDDEGEGIEQDQYLVFTAMGQEYGIQAMRVQEISAMIEITKVPKAPAYIEGILNLRGRLVSIINFRKKFGFPPEEHDEDTRIIIVEYRGFPIGILVDSVEEVIRIPNESVQKLPEATITTSSEEFLTGVGMLDKRLVILLDADRLLSNAEQLEVDAARKGNGEGRILKPDEAPGETAATREMEAPTKEGRSWHAS